MILPLVTNLNPANRRRGLHRVIVDRERVLPLVGGNAGQPVRSPLGSHEPQTLLSFRFWSLRERAYIGALSGGFIAQAYPRDDA
jgi:hypothetical protein